MPLQYSVFYCQLSKPERKRLEVELYGLIDPRADDVRIYGLKTTAAIQFMGQRPANGNLLIAGNIVLQNMHNG